MDDYLAMKAEVAAMMAEMAKTGSVSCSKCGWVYMSAPDRTFHTCSRYYMPECKANIPAKNCYDVSDAEAFSRTLQRRAKELLGMTGKANDRQEGGSHYKTKAIQPWDYVAANDLGYFEGNVIKYVTRFKDKHGIADLRKARHYLDKLIEVEEAKIVGNG